MSRAVKVQGIECPIIREGDNIVDIVVDSVLNPFKATSTVESEKYWAYKVGYRKAMEE